VTDEGIVYVTAGEKFVREAELSAESLREFNPKYPISIITNVENPPKIFDDVIRIDDPRYSFADKPFEIQLPYQKTVFLDTDILVRGDVSPIFKVLDRFDIAASMNSTNYGRQTCNQHQIPDTFPEYNTGVVGFKKSEKVEQFLRDWRHIFQADNTLRPGDQPAFRKALYNCELRIATLPPEYNCLFRYPGNVVGSIVCFHGRLINVESKGASKQYDAYDAAEKLNGTAVNRVFWPSPIGSFHIRHGRTILHRLRTRFASEGAKGVIERTIEQVDRRFR